MPHMLLRAAFSVSALTVAGAVALTAAPLAATAAPGAPGSGTATANVAPLRGYLTNSSTPVPSPAATQRRASIPCPTGTVPLGGGVAVQSSDPLVSVNSSFPFDGGWAADVNNASGSDTTFSVNVICAGKPAHYKVVQHRVANPAAGHTSAAATCPTGTRPLSGGGFSNSGSPFVTLSSTAPTGTRAWRVSENNSTGKDATLTALAVCGSVKGYAVTTGPVVSVPGNSIASLGTRCPTGRVPTGGGSVLQTSSLGAYLTLTTFGSSQDWVSFVTNNSATPFKASTTVVCAAALE